ncbi:MAG TPA: twin-arginine translocase TatA/TatE family subunit [Acidimicrobiales bacterium]|nr:twin-arginine translocase TatA/TatE family subunit [Acidimicrobiales bacterium]
MFSTIFSASNDLIVIVIALVVLFGGTQLPKLARNAGAAMKEFRKGHTDEPDDGATNTAATAGAGQAPASQSTTAAAPVVPVVPVVPAQPVVPVQPPALAPGQMTSAAAAAPAEERVTLTRAQLDALLADNEARAKAAQSEGKDGPS